MYGIETSLVLTLTTLTHPTPIARNISVFIPQSIRQNTIPRAGDNIDGKNNHLFYDKNLIANSTHSRYTCSTSNTSNTSTIPMCVVNILLMMDGEYGVVSAFVNRGGFDLAVSTGVAPESIMIGVPSTPDLLSAVDPSDRTYEMTFNICDPSLMDCDPATSGYTVDNTGGTDLLLSFITENVIPLVLDVIGMEAGGEISISGASLGGLTAVYAVATRPLTFARAFSLEGDMPYNFGQIADYITGNYSLHGNRAKAAVMMMV